MWPRVAELVIAAWLAASPFVLAQEASPLGAPPWLSDVSCAGLIAACALLSFTRRFGWLHFGEIAVAAWLLGYGFLAAPEATPALENDILMGLVLPMFAIIPNHATLPPLSWRAFRGAERV
jgi:hypothetical protein